MILLLGSLIGLLLLGIPIAYSLGLSGSLYFLIHRPELLSILPQRLFSGMDSYLMIALPLFVFMGVMLERAEIANLLKTKTKKG